MRLWEEYESEIGRRDLFRSLKEEDASEEALTKAAPDFTKTIKLVGIVLDQNPQAVLKDLETNQTLFLHPGQQIQGATLSEISEGKVILTYQDQKIEFMQ